MLKEKLESITEHLCNVHLFPENVEHKQCSHEPLDGERTKAWLDPESLVSLFQPNFVHLIFSTTFKSGDNQNKEGSARASEQKVE